MTIHVVLNHRKSNTTEFFITCSYAFDELVHNSDFFWLLIDVFRQLLEHFALVGMNTKLLTPKTRKHKSIINENHRAIKWTDDDVEVQFISVCIHNQYSYLPFGERCSHGWENGEEKYWREITQLLILRNYPQGEKKNQTLGFIHSQEQNLIDYRPKVFIEKGHRRHLKGLKLNKDKRIIPGLH